ncbi:MAG: pyridoxamine 5'-phosphate oxidase [Planctomycetota bacterium]|nr:pyridoxamine 5'-phosphate oxidase [Planctomycetota bacterium]MDA1162673.1 pyridoxamine 5'-phosphate oxidase [Planctomycetota bacterium]
MTSESTADTTVHGGRHPLYLEAINAFREKFSMTAELDVREPAAMSLATVDANGQPSIRTVLLRGIDERGFVFFTNSQSRKGTQIAGNPQVALNFYWDTWAEQVHVEGRVEIITDSESDQYWKKRARLSQIGAWASDQSRPLSDREEFLARVEEIEKSFKGQDIPRPPHWFGYRVVPNRIELWSGRAGRLHERYVYASHGEVWTKQMLYP